MRLARQEVAKPSNGLTQKQERREQIPGAAVDAEDALRQDHR
jgi:hypothetical protein